MEVRKVYLTEKQYVEYILFEYSKCSRLDESAFDITRLYKLLYRGCKTFKDFARRTMYIAGAGVISLTMLCSIINKCIPVSQDEKQELVSKVESASNTENDTKTVTEPRAKKPQVIDLNFKISDNGIEHIKQYEKCRLEPYFATNSEKKKGIRTIGWGHKITDNDPEWLRKATSITRQQADELFKNDLILYEGELAEVFKVLPKRLQNVNLYPQGFIDACISIIYNSGRGNLKASPFFNTLANCRIDKDGNIDKRDFDYTCSKIKQSCITQNGKVVQGLVNRRNTESLMAQQ